MDMNLNSIDPPPNFLSERSTTRAKSRCKGSLFQIRRSKKCRKSRASRRSRSKYSCYNVYDDIVDSEDSLLQEKLQSTLMTNKQTDNTMNTTAKKHALSLSNVDF